jgi:uncharacterized LabA/DUF88 family protein
MADTVKKRKVYLYVDGYNLYHRRLENNPKLKWLCLRTLASQFLFPKDEIISIKYFTAQIDPNQEKSPKRGRQLAYWEALKSTGVEIIEGLMEKRERSCKSLHCDMAVKCDPLSRYDGMTEKMSDVNMALHIYRDFLEKSPDIICVLSADLDVVPALKMIRETKKRVMIQVLLPTQDEGGLLFTRVQKHYQMAITRQLSQSFLEKSLFPPKIAIEGSQAIECPANWQI